MQTTEAREPCCSSMTPFCSAQVRHSTIILEFFLYFAGVYSQKCTRQSTSRFAQEHCIGTPGYEREEVLGRPASDLLRGKGTEPAAVAALEEAAAQGVERTVELLYYRKDGTSFCDQA